MVLTDEQRVANDAEIAQPEDPGARRQAGTDKAFKPEDQNKDLEDGREPPRQRPSDDVDTLLLRPGRRSPSQSGSDGPKVADGWGPVLPHAEHNAAQ